MRPIPDTFAKAIAANLGYDVVIIYARKEGNDGGECMSYAGSSYKMKRLADEMVRFLKQKVFGWSADIEEQSYALPEGPHGGDPMLGSKLIDTSKLGKKK